MRACMYVSCMHSCMRGCMGNNYIGSGVNLKDTILTFIPFPTQYTVKQVVLCNIILLYTTLPMF